MTPDQIKQIAESLGYNIEISDGHAWDKDSWVMGYMTTFSPESPENVLKMLKDMKATLEYNDGLWQCWHGTQKQGIPLSCGEGDTPEQAVTSAYLKMIGSDDEVDIHEAESNLSSLAPQLATEYEKLQKEIENLKFVESGVFDSGLEHARQGTQEVFIDPGSEPESCGFIEGDKPFCRIKFYEDSGDWSVGIQGIAFWCLDDDQSETELEKLQAKLDKAVGALEKLADIGGYTDRTVDKEYVRKMAQQALARIKAGEE